METKSWIVVIVVITVQILGICLAQSGNCHKINNCACVYDDGTIVNLTAIARVDGKPNFSNVTATPPDQYDDLYSWNPCTDFSYGDSDCQNVAVCVIRPKTIPNPTYYDLGAEDSAQFNVSDKGVLTLTYTADKGDFKRSAIITLQCMETALLDWLVPSGEQEPQNDTVIFTMTLASRYACALSPNIAPSQIVDNGMGAGVVVIIVLASLVGAYVVFGMAYQGLVKKESGIRLFPNHEFWCVCVQGSGKTESKERPENLITDHPKYESI